MNASLAHIPPAVQEWRNRSLAWLERLHAEDALHGIGPGWWGGNCDTVVELLSDDAPAPLPAGVRPVMWGGFLGEGITDGHCWFEWCGWILDPTSAQYGFEPFAVIAPWDARQAYYEPPERHADRARQGLEVRTSASNSASSMLSGGSSSREVSWRCSM